MKNILAILAAAVLLLGTAGFPGGSRELTEADGGKETPQAYILHITDQDGAPVPGVYVNFCTDLACFMAQSDETGTVTFDGAPDVYHIQLLKLPEGYSADPGFELYTTPDYGEWELRVQK